eukprot:Phypoly_transcript_11039.p1 GENE.Phypoly_transcript_11039~~Phypoly_transcript_11039.p1  ORF type:complete len:382 (+),score=54.51 Phypoly_transcript_11039:46-1146(+)
MAKVYYCSLNFYKAKGLAIGDVISSDPYLKVTLSSNPKIYLKTRPVFSTLNPTWDVEWHLSNVEHNSKFAIEVWDYDATSKDDKIGTCEYIFDGKEGEQEIQVFHRNKPHGKLTIKVACGESDKPGEVRWIGPGQAETHYCSFAGKLVNHKNDDSNRSYASYKLYLPYILNVFDVPVGWNQNYENAKTIFVPGVKSAAIQQVIRSQHARLYVHDNTTVYGTLRTGKDFLELFNNGRRQGIPRYYTYVILETAMYFSETGASFFTDFMSKHAMHSNAAEQVCFAGEFHVQQKDGNYVLVIDNNSGTYAPPKERVIKLVEFFKFNFPDLAVEAYDREDPALKEYKTVVSKLIAEENAPANHRHHFFFT